MVAVTLRPASAPCEPSPIPWRNYISDRRMLQNPPEGDWLNWRRTYDDYGFSPLKQINRSNVGDLRVAWTWSMPNGLTENTPLVHDGIHFCSQLWRQRAGT